MQTWISTSRESAVALYTVSVKSSALTAGGRMFDLQYHEQTAHSAGLQGSAPTPPHGGRSALTWTRHLAEDDTLSWLQHWPHSSRTPPSPIITREVVPWAISNPFHLLCGPNYRITGLGEMPPRRVVLERPGPPRILIVVYHKIRKRDCFAVCCVGRDGRVFEIFADLCNYKFAHPQFLFIGRHLLE